MLFLKTKIKLTAELVEPVPGLSMEEAKAEFTDAGQAEAKKEIFDEWREKLSAGGGQIIEGDVQFEFVEV